MKRHTKTGHKTKDLIPRPAVARQFGVCTRTVKRWESLYNLTPFKLTSRLTAYPAHQIEKIRTAALAAA